MAVCAGNILRSLIVGRPCRRYSMWERAHIRLRMALQAECINVADIQQTRVRRAVWRVAGGATFGLDDRVFKDKRTSCFRMALHADSVLIGRRFDQLALKCSVRIMAIAAFHQPFIHLMVKWLRKCGLHIGVAGVAELWLLNFEQARFILEAMHTVATGAA